MHQFRNDYNVLAHTDILKALERNADDQIGVYGLDVHSEAAEKRIKDIFGCPNASVFFLAGGTQTNLVLISSVLKGYEAVISLETGHINVHETGAIEGSGHKIITVKGKDRKMYTSDIEEVLEKYSDEHMVKPRMVYISNSTEIGTIYSKKELIDLHRTCKKNNLFFYLDGARLASALTSKDNDTTPKDLGELLDAFYIGGTKNGLLFGEALVINDINIQKDFRYHIKNKGAMLAKGYAVGIQFEEAFRDNLYFRLGKSTNDVADYLKEELRKIKVKTLYSPTNQIFAYFPKGKADKIIEEFGTELWSKEGNEMIIRFVVSFKTNKKDVDNLIKLVYQFLGRDQLNY